MRETRDANGEEELRQGVALDAQGRCRHWNGPTDVVLIRLPCCSGYWACHACHQEEANHPARRWPAHRFDEEAILCGACGSTLSIQAYLAATGCTSCGHPFNPRCQLHHPLYFDGTADGG